MSRLLLKKHFQSLEKAEIIETILEVYDSHKEIKAYFEYYLNPNEKAQFEKYKFVIDKEFSWLRSKPKKRISVARKAIADFARLKPSEELIGELMIHLVVMGCKLAFDYGKMSEKFYISMETNFERALKYISANGLLEKLKHKVDLCIEYSADCGYGFTDTMHDIYYTYYES